LYVNGETVLRSKRRPPVYRFVMEFTNHPYIPYRGNVDSVRITILAKQGGTKGARKGERPYRACPTPNVDPKSNHLDPCYGYQLRIESSDLYENGVLVKEAKDRYVVGKDEKAAIRGRLNGLILCPWHDEDLDRQQGDQVADLKDALQNMKDNKFFFLRLISQPTLSLEDRAKLQGINSMLDIHLPTLNHEAKSHSTQPKLSKVFRVKKQLKNCDLH